MVETQWIKDVSATVFSLKTTLEKIKRKEKYTEKETESSIKLGNRNKHKATSMRKGCLMQENWTWLMEMFESRPMPCKVSGNTHLSKVDSTFHKNKTYHPRRYRWAFPISMPLGPLEILKWERKWDKSENIICYLCKKQAIRVIAQRGKVSGNQFLVYYLSYMNTSCYIQWSVLDLHFAGHFDCIWENRLIIRCWNPFFLWLWNIKQPSFQSHFISIPLHL